MPHRNGAATTYAVIDDDHPSAITLVVDAAARRLRYHTTDGQAVVEQVVSANGTMQTRQLAVSGDGDVHPQGTVEFAACLTAWVGVRVTQECVNVCVSCVSGSWWNCPLCSACAGINGTKCAWDCRKLLCGCN